MDMDAVNAFNGEMSSMMDMTPPISRAKMMSVTKAGIKAIKLYKHVVQIVEKFIKRCKPELKVAGLYVADSIIRQSRHQFGADKDLFGPRFLKNFSATFQNLYECPVDDKAKILRVLNLWQKNDVFGMDIIQPLVDMASAPVFPVLENGTTVGVSLATPMSVPHLAPSAATTVTLPTFQNSVATHTLQNQVAPPTFQNPVAFHNFQNQVPMAPPTLQTPVAPPTLQTPVAPPTLQTPVAPPTLQTPVAPPTLQTPVAPPSLQNPVALSAVAQLLQGTQGIEQLLQSLQQSGVAGPPQSTAPPPEQKPSLAKTLLDRFDYDDEPEPMEETPEPAPAPAAPLTINLPIELQQAIQAHLLSQLANQNQVQDQVAPQGLPVMGQNQIPEDTVQPLDESSVPPSVQQPQDPVVKMDHRVDDRERRHRRSKSRSPQRLSSSSSRSRRSRSGSRSGSRSHRTRYHRTRSRSRERRARSEERREREKERERRQKGLPPTKKETLSVCSTTLWIGQLDKKTLQQDIMSLMEEFGQIESINMIPPRGCAYIVMVHRQDAYTALNKLSRGNVKVNQKSIKIAWALNKGIKSEFKKYWDVERGVTYIPWGKVKPDDIQSYRDGGILDVETLKSEWNVAVAKPAVPVAGGPEGGQGDGAAPVTVSQSPTLQPLAPVNVPPIPLLNINLTRPPLISEAPPLAFPRPGFNPAQMPAGFPPAHPVAPMNSAGPLLNNLENPMEDPSRNSHRVHTDMTGGPPLSPPSSGGLLGPRPGSLPPHSHMGPSPPFMQPFPNDMPRPNMQSPNMPHPNMPSPNMPHPNMQSPNMPHPNMPSPNMPHPNMQSPNMPHPNTPSPNMPRPNMPSPNMPRPNMPSPNMPRPNMQSPNMPRPNMPSQNMPRPNMQSPNMPRPNMPSPNMPRPNMQSPNMPPQMMSPRGPNPMHGEPPAGRFRMPMMGPPVKEFHPPREGFSPRGPPRGPRVEEEWEEEPDRNNWRERGPERGPERFEHEPQFHRGGWGRGGRRGRGRFGN
nr:SR-related and CTD-associated factor 4b [Misgurnus anguillicaudatus]